MSTRIPISSRVSNIRKKKGEPTTTAACAAAAAGTRNDRRHAPLTHKERTARVTDNPRPALSTINTNRRVFLERELSHVRTGMPDIVKSTAVAARPRAAQQQRKDRWDVSELHVDAKDAGNPACCTEYVTEIHANLRELETQPCYSLRPGFLNHHLPSIKGSHRAVLIEWLVLVTQRLSMVPETPYITVDIIDRYLQAAPSLSRSKLQLLGVTALFIASKYEEITIPSVGDLVRLSAETYRHEDILEMERTVLKTLDYRFGKPTAITFLRRYSKAAMTNVKSHHLAKYILELTLLSTSLSVVPPSRRAAAALLYSRSLLYPTKTTAQQWPPSIVHHSGYRMDVLQTTKTQLHQALRRAHSEGSGGDHAKSIREKYASPAFMNVSELVQLTSTKYGREISVHL